MTQYGPAEWWYPTGALATNQRAVVFGPGDQNVLASIFADAAMTVPLPNPTTTDALGLLEFHAADGTYWIFVGPVGTGDSVEITLGASPDNPVLSVNGQAPDGGGNVELDAADVGADPAGSAAAAAAASQPLATINGKGDLYVGTGPDATTRLGPGPDGLFLIADSGQPTGLGWAAAGGGAVDSVNGQTGVVVLGAADVGADPAGSAAAVQALALLKAQNLNDVPNKPTARTNLGLGTAATADTGTGPTQVVLGNDARLTDARTPTAHASTHAAAGSDPVTIAESQVSGLTAALAGKQPLATNLTQIAATAPANGDMFRRVGGVIVAQSMADIKTALAITAADVGADPAGSAAAAQAASQPVDADLTAIAGLSPNANDTMQFIGGAWANRSVAQVKTTLAYTAADVGALALALADAKGDQFVASAPDTIIRVPVGTNGHVWTADSAETSGAKWAAAPGAVLPGALIPCHNRLVYPGGGVTFSVASIGNNNQYYLPISVDRLATWIGLQAEISGTAGEAGSVLWAGYYAADASTNMPTGSPIASFGNVAATSTGFKNWAFSVAAIPGVQLYASIVYQGATGTPIATLRRIATAPGHPAISSSASLSTGGSTCYVQTGVTANPPGAVGTITPNIDCPRLGLTYTVP